MSTKEIRGQSPEQLDTELLELRKEQFNLRMQKATGQLGNTSRIKIVRREIARIKTIMTEKAKATS